MDRRRIFQVTSAAIMLSGLVAATLLCTKVIDREHEELRQSAELEAKHIAGQLQESVVSRIDTLEKLGQWWITQGHPFDLEDWRSDGQLFLSGSPGLLEAVWVGVDGVQRWSAKPGKEPVWRRVRASDRLRPLVAAAAKRRSKVVSDVFSTPESAAAMYACSPVFAREGLRGYVIGLYDLRTLIASLARTEIRADSQIKIMAGGREVFSTLPNRAARPEELTLAAVTLPEQNWTVALRVPLNYFREFKGSILAVVSVIGALMYAFAMLLTLSQRRSSELQKANSALESEVARRVRKEAEARDLNRELSLKINDFQTLLGVIPIGIAVAEGARCANVRVNPAMAEMLGLPQAGSLSSLGGRPYKVSRDGRELREDELPLQIAVSGRRPVVAEENQLTRADGTTLDVLSFAAPLFDENGAVRGALHACVNITERKTQEQLRRELEQRLHRAQRMKSLGVMAAGVAHDFNNLLTAIIGHASLAAKCLPDHDQTQHHLACVLQSGERAANLVHQLLAYTGRSYHTLRPTDVGGLIGGMQTSLMDLAGGNAQLRFDIAAPLPKAMADPDEIRQVLGNLVTNAMESKEGDTHRIEISVDTQQLSGTEKIIAPIDEGLKPGPYVCVCVRDSGAGMPPEIAEKAFDPFFSTKFLGRGLGLSEVMGIMRAHQGAVRLETARHRGTSVELFFPVTSDETEGPSSSSDGPVELTGVRTAALG